MNSKVIIERLSQDTLKLMGVFNWPIWQKEVSVFDWYYDTDEQCYFIEGDVEVETDEGTFKIKKGDFVTFKKGLSCKWHVKSPVSKHYHFQ
ncbi:MAG: cupin domain-containing protein [Bacteroidales bacterium]|nr:cupin domain-containing protein [Bacteroidales bacterium]